MLTCSVCCCAYLLVVNINPIFFSVILYIKKKKCVVTYIKIQMIIVNVLSMSDLGVCVRTCRNDVDYQCLNNWDGDRSSEHYDRVSIDDQ